MPFGFERLNWRASSLATTTVPSRTRRGVHRASIDHQAADTLLIQKTTGTNHRQIKEELWYRASSSPAPEREGMNVMYLPNTDVIYNKGVGLLAVYDIQTSTESEHDKRQIIVQDFICRQAKDSYYGKASCTLVLPGSVLSFDRNGFLTRTEPICRPTKNLSHVTTSTAFVSLAVNMAGRTSGWKIYIRQR